MSEDDDFTKAANAEQENSRLNAIQKRALLHMASGGRVGLYGLRGVPVEKASGVLAIPALTMKRLLKLEFVQAVEHGLYELTSAGRAAAQSLPTTLRQAGEDLRRNNRLVRHKSWPARS